LKEAEVDGNLALEQHYANLQVLVAALFGISIGIIVRSLLVDLRFRKGERFSIVAQRALAGFLMLLIAGCQIGMISVVAMQLASIMKTQFFEQGVETAQWGVRIASMQLCLVVVGTFGLRRLKPASPPTKQIESQ
jgi:NO-binding membrane sensor protein with MHYT domain